MFNYITVRLFSIKLSQGYHTAPTLDTILRDFILHLTPMGTGKHTDVYTRRFYHGSYFAICRFHPHSSTVLVIGQSFAPFESVTEIGSHSPSDEVPTPIVASVGLHLPRVLIYFRQSQSFVVTLASNFIRNVFDCRRCRRMNRKPDTIVGV
jgi:hypothetical protein